MGRKRQRLTDGQWRRVFERQRRSGLSIVAFCDQEGVPTSTFFAKRRQLEVESEPGEPTSSSAFVEVAPIGDAGVTGLAFEDADDGGDDHVGATEAGEPLELVLRSDVVVRVRPGFDAGLLRRVVEVLS